MTRLNCIRSGCTDVFRAFLVKNAEYDGELEIPIIKPQGLIPNKLIVFSKALKTKDYKQWVHFFEDDYQFERIWNNPKKYLRLLKKFKGVILPDFSLYRDMPLVMQLWNIYRSRAIGIWLQQNGVNVIPNIRFGDNRTWQACCLGIAKHGIIAVGAYGCTKRKNDREYFISGFDYVIRTLEPKIVIIYGSDKNKFFDIYRQQGIIIKVFEPDIQECSGKDKS